MDPSANLLPESGLFQRLFNFPLQNVIPVHSSHPEPVGYIFKDRFWKGIRFLKDHADAHPDFDGVDLRVDDIESIGIEEDLPLIAVAGVKVVHPVEAPEISGLSAPRGPDEGCDLFIGDREVDVLECLDRVIIKIKIDHFSFQRFGEFHRHEFTILSSF